MTRELKWYVRGLSVAFLLLAGALAAGSQHVVPARPVVLLPLLAIAIVAEALTVASQTGADDHVLSFSATAHIAAAILFGPLPAAAIAVVAVVAVDGARLVHPRWIALNASMFGTAILVAATCYQQAGGTNGEVNARSVLALLVLGVTRPLVNAILYSIGVVVSTGKLLRDVLIENLVQNMSVSAGELSLGLLVASEYNQQRWIVLPFLVPLLLALYRSSSTLERLKRETTAALRAFARVIDQRDPNTAQHTERVAEYVERFVTAIGIPDREAQRLVAAARFHDLGKVAVDVSTLSSNRRLTEDELRAIRSHPRLSARLLAPFHFAREMAVYAELHHERFDGTGYYGVPTSEVPIEAHVLIAADSFDAMTSTRPYRPPLPIAEAAAELRARAGSQFHPLVARAFAAMVEGSDPAGALSPSELVQLRRSFARVSLGVDMSRVRSLLCPPVVAALLTTAALVSAVVADRPIMISLAVGAALGNGWMIRELIGARRRRAAATSALVEGRPNDALQAAGVPGHSLLLRWDTNADAYVCDSDDAASLLEVEEVCSRALRAFSSLDSGLATGNHLWLSSDDDWALRLAVVTPTPLTSTQRQIAELIAAHIRSAETPIARRTEALSSARDDSVAGDEQTLIVQFAGFDEIRTGAGHLVARSVVQDASSAIQAVLRGGDRLVKLAEDSVGVQLTDPNAVEHIKQRIEACLTHVEAPIRTGRLTANFSVAATSDCHPQNRPAKAA